MTSRHSLFMNAINERRTLKAGASSPALARLIAAQEGFTSDIDVLNYALTLEHLEAAFYQLTSNYELGEDPYGNSINEYATVTGEHETAHVDTLTQVITDLGGEPVMAAQYDFGVTDAQGFLQVASALENVGVAAYDGAAAAIENPDLLTAAGSIVAVEARHAAYFNILIGESPFPAAFETPMTPEEVLDAAGGFIVSN